MKTYVGVALTIATTFVLTGATAATAQDNGLKASVPLEFRIGKTTLPRGVYSISRLEGQMNVLLIRGDRRSVIVRADGIGTDRRLQPQLVFHRTGDQYFLREIRFSAGAGMSLPETREERGAADQRAEVETVVVPAERR